MKLMSQKYLVFFGLLWQMRTWRIAPNLQKSTGRYGRALKNSIKRETLRGTSGIRQRLRLKIKRWCYSNMKGTVLCNPHFFQTMLPEINILSFNFIKYAIKHASFDNFSFQSLRWSHIPRRGLSLRGWVSGPLLLRRRLFLIYAVAFANVFCAHRFPIITRKNVELTSPFQKLKFKRFMIYIPYSFIFLSNWSVLNNNGLLPFLKNYSSCANCANCLYH